MTARCWHLLLLFYFFQAGTGDEFLDELLSNDASLDDGAVPDIKVIDSSINMTGNEVSLRILVKLVFALQGNTLNKII